ncbi:MAG: integration host factor subunit beta [Planctomycetes bacterium]|nr:integration host factor subunit beta [Planctomycetota bacterium]
MAEEGKRTVSKREIAERVARKAKQTQLVAKRIIQLFLDELIEELAHGNKLEFRDFGVFDVVQRKRRVGRNPRTGERVAVPAKRVVSFKMGRLMRDRVAAPQEGE